MKMPHRSGFPDGLIAIWGEVTLEQLDQESIKVLADRKGLKKGLLIDFLGNFVRSAKAGLPVYRIDGGPGFVWVASFDQKGRGFLRLGAVDASKFLLPAEQQPTGQTSGATSEGSGEKSELGEANEQVQPALKDAIAVMVDPESKVADQRAETEVARAVTGEKVQPELPDTTATNLTTNETAQPEPTDTPGIFVDAENKVAAAAERIQSEDVKVEERIQSKLPGTTAAVVDPENIVVSKWVEAEDARITERANLDAGRGPLEAKGAIGDAYTSWWKVLGYGLIVSLLTASTIFAIVFYRRRRIASALERQVLLHRRDLIEVAAKPAISKTLSPEEALDRIEAIRRSLLESLASSPSLVPTFSSKGPMQSDAAFRGAKRRSLEKLEELV
jgi:hypothetical protein